jgi:hypothetical protein
MKKFSDLINENENLKKYKFVANLKVEGTVEAFDEGSAGEEVDKEIDQMTQYVTNVTTYEIESIDEMQMLEENVVIEKPLLNEDPEVQIDKEIKDIFDLVESKLNKYSEYEKNLFKLKLLEKINK